MSQYHPSDPYGQQPQQVAQQGYAPYDAPYAPYATPAYHVKRPTSVTVLAIISICYGGMGVLGILTNSIQMFVKIGPPNPVMDAFTEGPVLSWWMPLATVISGILSIVQLVGGVGALSLKEWGRKALLIDAIASLVMSIAGVITTALYIVPSMQKVPQDRPEVRMMVTIMPPILYGTYVLALILPILILIFMTRARVKAAFAAAAAARELQPQ